MQLEGYRQVEVASHCHTIVLAGLPFRHSLYNSKSLAVKVLINALKNCCGTDGTVLLNDEFYDNTTLDIVLLS